MTTRPSDLGPREGRPTPPALPTFLSLLAAGGLVLLGALEGCDAGGRRDRARAQGEGNSQAGNVAKAGPRERAHAASKDSRAAVLPPTPWRAGAIAHGGVGSGPELSAGCRAAVTRALAALEAGADPLDAAVAGVRVLEDDPRYNAGTGSRVRLDGVTVQMDAAVMDSTGRFGAVAGIEQVQNPVLVARAVANTPHRLLAGDGAIRFARTLGLPVHDPATAEMRRDAERLRQALLTGGEALPMEWHAFDWRKHWNFEAPPPAAAAARARRALPVKPAPRPRPGSDTVGVAVRSASGRFAVALSTGGTSVTLRGRVGDVPILGAGLYAGRHGAAAATGTGELIMDRASSRGVHALLERGVDPEKAAHRAVEAIRGRGAMGIIVITAQAFAAAADRPMAWAAREVGSDRWQGPGPPSPAPAPPPPAPKASSSPPAPPARR